MQVKHIRYPIKDTSWVQPSVVAIGTFDGVHLGHQQVLQRARTKAANRSAIAAVVTFDPHPREVLDLHGTFEYLTPLPEKLMQFAKREMDVAYVVHFNRQLASLSPEQFVEEMLIPLQIQEAVVGFNYTFGHRASGKAEDLKALGKNRFTVDIVSPIDLGGEPVSSTRLRRLLRAGDVQAMARLLGRPYCIRGTVVHGAGRGKALGFPTANLALEERYALPKTGIYVVRVERGEAKLFGVASVGYNPTFEKDRKQPSVEVYLLDVDERLYGEQLSVYFHRYLRAEQKFSSASQLVEQMHRDVQQAREWISNQLESGQQL